MNKALGSESGGFSYKKYFEFLELFFKNPLTKYHYYGIIQTQLRGATSMSKNKEDNPMGKKEKRRRRKPSAPAEGMKTFGLDILSAIIAGLATAAILKLLDW